MELYAIYLKNIVLIQFLIFFYTIKIAGEFDYIIYTVYYLTVRKNKKIALKS